MRRSSTHFDREIKQCRANGQEGALDQNPQQADSTTFSAVGLLSPRPSLIAAQALAATKSRISFSFCVKRFDVKDRGSRWYFLQLEFSKVPFLRPNK